MKWTVEEGVKQLMIGEPKLKRGTRYAPFVNDQVAQEVTGDGVGTRHGRWGLGTSHWPGRRAQPGAANARANDFLEERKQKRQKGKKDERESETERTSHITKIY
jgi:hypothetical protein